MDEPVTFSLSNETRLSRLLMYAELLKESSDYQRIEAVNNEIDKALDIVQPIRLGKWESHLLYGFIDDALNEKAIQCDQNRVEELLRLRDKIGKLTI